MLTDLARMVVTSAILGVLLVVAMVHNTFERRSKKAVEKPPREASKKEERAIKDIMYYCERYNYDCEEHRTVTHDGFTLLLYRVRSKLYLPNQTSSPSPSPSPLSAPSHGVAAGLEGLTEVKGHPVILQHGLFMGGGVFVLNEETSMAFYLADQGYDVWLGNNRGVALEHQQHRSHDEQFWDWSVDDLARYDVPAIIEHVCHVTGQPQVTWVGHSQGNGQAFMALSTDPEVQRRVKLFIALAPTARLGDLPSEPLKILRRDSLFENFMGKKQFIPMINHVLVYAPAEFFAVLAYHMFYYLFKWSDNRWHQDRKAKYFQFSGLPVSCKQIRHWMKMTEKGALYNYETGELYPVENIQVPMAIFHGDADEIADADSLLEVLQKSPSAQLRHFEKIPDYEHLDLIWAVDCREKVYEKIHGLILQELGR